MPAITLQPLTEAVQQISRRTPVGSALSSAEWQEVPLALRQTAQFSARVSSARVLQSIQDRMQGLISLSRERLGDRRTATFDRGSFIDAIRGIAREEGLDLNLREQDRGTVRDITSIPRLGMIFDMQQAQAQGAAKWKADHQEGALLLYPAWEFTRVESRKEPRQNWPRRWVAAGGKLYGGRMIALKTDPVWRKLSRFGTPWPPFDFNSGMGLEDIDRQEAISLGVMTEDQEIRPEDNDFRENLEASVRGLDDTYIENLMKDLNDEVTFDGERVNWKGSTDEKNPTYSPSRRQDNQAPADPRRSGQDGRSVFEGFRSRNTGAEVPTGIPEEVGASLFGVSSGTKPLYHDEYGEKDVIPLARALRSVLPKSLSVQAVKGHLYVYNPSAIKNVLKANPRAYPGRSTLERIHAASVAGTNGELLGYGARQMIQKGNVRVRIIDPSGKPVFSFFSTSENAEFFGAQRAQEWSKFYGQPYSFEIGS